MSAVIRRNLRRDERGVASTVGTIMALLIFLMLLTVIVNAYVPAWMRDAEAAHVHGAVAEFGDIKSGIDSQILLANLARNMGTASISGSRFSAGTLGVDGVPLFASPTYGTLSFEPNVTMVSLSFTYMIGNVPQTVTARSTGVLQLSMANRYFLPVTLLYGDGAVIRSQSDGQFVVVPPTFEIQKVSGTLHLGLGLVSLFGNQLAVTGVDLATVSTLVDGYDLQAYRGFTGPGLQMVFSSPFGLAWYDFLNTTLANALHLPGTYEAGPLEREFEVHLNGTALYEVEAEYNPASQLWTVELEIKNNPALPLQELDLSQAVAQVAINKDLPRVGA